MVNVIMHNMQLIGCKLTLTIIITIALVSTELISAGLIDLRAINLGEALNKFNGFYNHQQSQTNKQNSLNVFCYMYHTSLYSSLSSSHNGDSGGSFDWKSDNIWSTCSHIIYAFAGVDDDSNTLLSVEPRLDLGPNDEQQQQRRQGYHDMMRKVNEFKRINNNKQSRSNKVLLSVGGAGSNEAVKLNKIASNLLSRRQFADNCLEYLLRFGFDGLDLDWEYPDDEHLLLALVQELHNKLKRKSLLLTLTLPPGVWTARGVFNLANVSKYLDHLNIMAYDYYGPWSERAGSNAPLRASSREEAYLNVDQIVQYYKNEIGKNLNNQAQLTAAWQKLGLGIPFYARGFLLLTDNNKADNKASDNRACKQEPTKHFDVATNDDGDVRLPREIDIEATREYNLAFHYEFVCNQIANKKLLSFYRDKNEMTPTAILKHQRSNRKMFLSWEDPISIEAKVKYAKEQGLGSVMIWKLDSDDFANTNNESASANDHCHSPDFASSSAYGELGDSPGEPGSSFPLLTAVKRANASLN